ncbi:hypothetical protein DL762_001340 [Monosporascus cannonballus]|uniref:GED domain-containing protein n=1 Tax=Monosporascus cannonballus TaxID=155416 RepID=A0ABY0HH34_9PEZI|nr:hypothetical protein DL762_001340 [Monosporascus cannonballus]RYP00387.1 hypothetical protein DL763_000853 [Monosporascus cannonballus]
MISSAATRPTAVGAPTSKQGYYINKKTILWEIAQDADFLSRWRRLRRESRCFAEPKDAVEPARGPASYTGLPAVSSHLDSTIARRDNGSSSISCVSGWPYHEPGIRGRYAPSVALSFGQGAGDFTFTSSGTGTIPFRSLHNVSPSPSPRFSRTASPVPSYQLTTPEVELSRLTLNEASSVHQRHAESLQPPAAHSGSPMPNDTWLSPPQAEFSRLTLTESPSTRAASGGPPRSSLYQFGSPAVNRASSSEATQGRTPLTASPAVDIASYNVRDEQLPTHPFFTSSFQTALKAGLDIAKGVANTIQSIPDSIERGPEIHRLLKDAKSLSSFVGSDTRTIAVLGDSGQGKSSLINSLLHFPDIAKTGDTGSACTSVVTEYRQKTKEHSAAPIIIEVEYLAKDEIAEMVRELLWSYRQLFLPGVDSDTTSAVDYARYTRESEQAWSALEAAFQHQSRFSKEMLRDMSEGALERIQDQLIAWTNDMEWPDGGEAGCWKSTAGNAEECREKTGLFMQDRYWPFTKIIRVYVNAQVLKTGLILADLPGLQDTNLARVRATEKYLMRQEWFLIEARNEHIKDGLRKAYAAKIPGEKLDVFCVSNTTYEKYSEKGDEELVRASGIPQLRQFCHSITAEAQFREALDRLQARLPTLINSLELWANTNLTAYEQESLILDVCVYRILTDVDKEKRYPAWEKAARGEGQRWLDGDHATPSRSREDWNAKIIWKMRMELAYQWDLVEDEIPSLFESLLDTIKSELGYLKDQVENSARSDVSKALNEGIDSRIKGLEYTLGLEKEKFASAVRLVRRDASESNYNSFILKEMIPAYREASSQRGSGRDTRQKQIVQNRITDGTLFLNMSIAIGHGIGCAVKKSEKAIRDILEQSMSNIRNDFDLTITSPPKAIGTSGDGRWDGDSAGLVKQRETLVEQAKLFKERHASLLESIASLK